MVAFSFHSSKKLQEVRDDIHSTSEEILRLLFVGLALGINLLFGLSIYSLPISPEASWPELFTHFQVVSLIVLLSVVLIQVARLLRQAEIRRERSLVNNFWASKAIYWCVIISSLLMPLSVLSGLIIGRLS